ncbi:MAG: endonuclease III [bacterium]|nr:endonuclease III [bacterium]
MPKKTATKKKATRKTKSGTAKKRPRAPATKPPARFRGMDVTTRAVAMFDTLTREYPDAHCMLDFTNAFELLIATILAAQCTDVMVNRVTPDLFRRYPRAPAFLKATDEKIQEMIFKTGFYRQKTKSIKKCCRALVDEHDGEVPSAMEDLVALAGVGRKTANCVRGNVFNLPGIVVDTHVKRLAYRMGFTVETNPDKIERDLNAIVPEKEWTHVSHLLADHGRAVCDARRPLCETCPVEHLCPKYLD